LEKKRRHARRTLGPSAVAEIDADIAELKGELVETGQEIPDSWKTSRTGYVKLAAAEKKTRRDYRKNADGAYEPVVNLRKIIAETSVLAGLDGKLKATEQTITGDAKQAMDAIKVLGAEVGAVAGAGKVRSELNKAARALRGDNPKPALAADHFSKAKALYSAELDWRRKAESSLAAGLASYDEAIRGTIGVRMQERLSETQAQAVADCQSHHRDISLDF
jgi:hypothetical protein